MLGVKIASCGSGCGKGGRSGQKTAESAEISVNCDLLSWTIAGIRLGLRRHRRDTRDLRCRVNELA